MDLEATLEYDRWIAKLATMETTETDPGPSERGALLGKMKQKAPYPKAIMLIFLTEICERFSYFGMRAVLILYFTSALHYTDVNATMLYHTFVMLCYMSPVLGGIIADSRLGKFRTILCLSTVYSIGIIVLSLAATPPLHIPAITFSMIGLVLQSLGTGGIKANVAAFGGDQFLIPEQEKKLTQFFFIFYFSVNCGAALSMFLTPILRDDVSCFGEENCYTLAFGFPATLMIVALVIFMVGRPLYKIRIPEENVFLQTIGCVVHALTKKNSSINGTKPHWLDNADDKYDKQFIEDLKQVLHILVLFIPFPIFWSLFEQQGSTWTLQATRMDGYIYDGWTLKPDQMQMSNPVLILILVPLFDRVIYPLLGKCGFCKKLLQRMTFGSFLAAVAYVLAGLVELQLEPTYAVIPNNFEANLNFINTLPCPLNISLTVYKPSIDNSTTADTTVGKYASGNVFPLDNFIFEKIQAANYELSIDPTARCSINGHAVMFPTFNVKANSSEATSLLIEIDANNQVILVYPKAGDDLAKSTIGNSKLRVMYAGFNSANSTLVLTPTTTGAVTIDLTFSGYEVATNTTEIDPGSYSVSLQLESSAETSGANSFGAIKLQRSGNYLLAIFPDYSDQTKSPLMKLYVLTSPNSVSLLLQFPQYLIITLAEVLFAVTGYTLSYTQAPKRFKAFIMSVWLLGNGLGNLIVILVTEADIFPRQSIEFFAFAVLMLLATILFIVLALRYKLIETQHTTPLRERKRLASDFAGLGSSTGSTY